MVGKSKEVNQEHKQFAAWAATCAEHVLPVFENNYPNDDRPRKAIAAARAWVQGELTVSEARKAAFAAHAAARGADSPESKAAARAAGPAAATAHVATHAKYAASYALKAAADADAEREWQLNVLPEQLQSVL